MKKIFLIENIGWGAFSDLKKVTEISCDSSLFSVEHMTFDQFEDKVTYCQTTELCKFCKIRREIFLKILATIAFVFGEINEQFFKKHQLLKTVVYYLNLKAHTCKKFCISRISEIFKAYRNTILLIPSITLKPLINASVSFKEITKQIKENNIKCIFFFLDRVAVLKQKKHFGKSFQTYLKEFNPRTVSYNFSDCVKHKYQYSPYSFGKEYASEMKKEFELNNKRNKKYEITVVNTFARHAYQKILKINKFCKENSIKVLFKLVYTPGDGKIKSKEKEEITRISYKQTLKRNTANFREDSALRVFQANCVCHISKSSSPSPTPSNYVGLSMLEAVYEDKKILTDSDIVKLETWYDPRLVRVVDYENLIKDDADWIKRETNIKYQNKESISPEACLERILKRT